MKTERGVIEKEKHHVIFDCIDYITQCNDFRVIVTKSLLRGFQIYQLILGGSETVVQKFDGVVNLLEW